MKKRPKCTCGQPYFGDHILSCPVLTKQVMKAGTVELWADQGRQVLCLVRYGREISNTPRLHLQQGFDQPHLSPCGKHIHTHDRTRSRFKCKCRGTGTSGCPTHQWYQFPTHQECRGDGCANCYDKGYIEKQYILLEGLEEDCVICGDAIKYRENYFRTPDGPRHLDRLPCGQKQAA